MDFHIAVGSKICEYTVGPVAGQLGYIYHYKRNVDNVKSQTQRLEGEKARMQHSIEEARRNGEEIERAVEEWMNEVTGILEKAYDEFFKDEDYAMPLCSSKLFLNLVSRRRLSKIANSLAETAGDEMQRANTLIQKVFYLVPPQSAAIEMTKGSYMIFPSRTSIFNIIMEALRNPDVKMIGVYGMGGVGKTMLAKEVVRKAVDDDKLFKKAVIVTVSQTPALHKIKKEIAHQLGLNFDNNGDDENVRAKRLRLQLGREENMLLVIDDVWEKLELYEVGIAFGNEKNDCKILLNSRSRDVVRDMDTNLYFPLEDLRFDEAKDLFDKIVRDQSIKNPDHFFEATKELKVLHLTSACLEPLPSSFEFLENLRTLVLNWCEIEDVALIGELRNLKILDLAYSQIGNLPRQIGQLTRLQLLDLSYCSKLEVIECNVISNLVHLEELYMLETFTRWDIEGGHSGRRNASLMELKNLSRLTNLHLHMPDVNVMPKDLFSVNLKRYDILIGERPTQLDDSFARRKPASRKLELN